MGESDNIFYFNEKDYFLRQNDLTTNVILQDGDQGPEVEKLQKYLVQLGFLRGIPNGIFGLATKRAVELFQLSYDLPRTGIVDETTWNNLKEAIDNPLPSAMPTLSLGDEGVNVKSLQHRLIVLGFLETTAKGIFDESTNNAVIRFQTARGITPDGIVGPETWRALNQMIAAVEVNIPTIKPTIQEGNQNDYVKLLQNMLTSYGYYFGNVDGIFGRNTTNAVIKFQKTYGLDPNGIVDYFTWEVLDSLLRPEFRHIPILKEGSTAPEVKILQEKLHDAGFFYNTITGSFGPETTTALKNFQSANNLNITGITDRETWITLFEQTAIIADNFLGIKLGTTPIGQRPTLRYGDNNVYVSELQRDLQQLGFYSGTIDGVFGSGTQNAVKAFQVNNKLTADGIVGRQTWSALIYLYSPLAICNGTPSVPTPEAPNNFRGVVIDAGHGGTDPGASGNGIIEKEFTLKMSQYMANRFRELGIPFSMTRTTDETLSLNERTNRINNAFGTYSDVIMISNHLNSSESGTANGAEIIYALRNTPELAEMILDEIGKTGMNKRKVYQRTLPEDSTQDYYHIIRNSKPIQSLIVEYGFLSNTSDAIKLKNEWESLSEATVKAVTNYIGAVYTPPLAGKVVHIVQAGDTLWSIANAFNTTVAAIKNLNNLTSDTLQIGQQLIVSGKELETPPPSGNIVYVVQPGDSLYSIARKFETTVDEIMQLNNLTSTMLHIGQQLFIPGVSIEKPEPTLQAYTVQPGDTLYSIAVRFNTTVNELIQINNLATTTLHVGQQLLVPVTEIGTFTYTVQPGDSLYSIANKFNTTVETIMQLNNLTSTMLQIGQQLIIPTPGKTTINYIVQRGDTLWSIANRFNTTVDDIMRLNNMTNTTLQVGQELIVPRI